MGYNVSTVNNLPLLSGYYFFLMGKELYASGMSAKTLYNRFDEIAERLGSNSAIIKFFDPKSFTEELLEYFLNTPWHDKMYENFKYSEPCLIIMQGHPKYFNFKKYLFALISFETLDDIYESEEELCRDIIALSIDGDLRLLELVNKKNDGIGIIKRIRRSLILEPNFNGIGISINKLIMNKRHIRNIIFGFKQKK